MVSVSPVSECSSDTGTPAEGIRKRIPKRRRQEVQTIEFLKDGELKFKKIRCIWYLISLFCLHQLIRFNDTRAGSFERAASATGSSIQRLSPHLGQRRTGRRRLTRCLASGPPSRNFSRVIAGVGGLQGPAR